MIPNVLLGVNIPLIYKHCLDFLIHTNKLFYSEGEKLKITNIPEVLNRISAYI